MTELLAISIGAVVAAALLIVEHVTLWQQPWTLSRPASYAVGTATLGLGISITAALLNQPLIAYVFWGVAIPAGAMVIIAYWMRAKLDSLTKSATKRSALAALIIEESEEARGTARQSDYRNN